MNNIFKFCLVFFCFWVANAQAAFVGDYDFANWSSIKSRGGSITTSGNESVILESSNTPKLTPQNRNQDFIIESTGNGIVKFDWSYLTTDSRGPGADPFGWLLNGVFTALTSDTGGKSQSGIFSFNVQFGDLFGFRMNSTDSRKGSATATVSDFSGLSAVPAPGALWLMLAPALAMLRNRKKI